MYSYIVVQMYTKAFKVDFQRFHFYPLIGMEFSQENLFIITHRRHTDMLTVRISRYFKWLG